MSYDDAAGRARFRIFVLRSLLSGYCMILIYPTFSLSVTDSSQQCYIVSVAGTAPEYLL